MQDYINKLKDLYQTLLEFLENDDDYNDDIKTITSFVENQKILFNRMEFMEFLYLISKISKYHNDNKGSFNNKIQEILLFYKDDLKKNFSNKEIFNFFKNNKRILLFLIKKEIITVDETIANLLCIKYEFKSDHFFYPEIKPFICKTFQDRIEENAIIHDDNFEFKRQSGVNDSYICSLIHQDLVEEFIKYSNQTNMQLSVPIKQSTFETNYFLIKNQPNLINYAIYYDSIQIVQYLLYNNVKLTESSWIYAIHSNSAQMIHLLEENHVEMRKDFVKKIYFEAIKCNHNNIARYLMDNHLNLDNIYYNFKNNIIRYSIKYRNYENFPDEFNDESLFVDIYENGYNMLAIHFMKKMKEIYPYSSIENDIKLIRPVFLSSVDIFYYLLKNKKSIDSKFIRQISFNDIAIPPTIKSIDISAFEKCSCLTHIFIPNSITSIGKSAFARCSKLTQIKIPYSVTSIEENAFYECENLSKVIIPYSVTIIKNNAFKRCKSLKSILIPSSVTKIRESSFAYCGLEEITIPESVTTIGYFAFQGCSSLKKITIISRQTTFVDNTFTDCGMINEIECDILQVINIVNNSKYYFKLYSASKMSITFPDNYNWHSFNFTQLYKIKQIAIVSPLKFISNFGQCNSLREINLPSSLVEIGHHTFQKCSSLQQIIIPPSVKVIGEYAFDSCESLTDITFSIESSLEKIENNTFYQCTSLRQIVIPSSVKLIGEMSFYECRSLEQITFEKPSSLSTIGKSTFEECTSLKQIEIPSSVKSIGEKSFYKCKSLEQIAFERPSYLSTIGKSAFEECTSLKQIEMPSSLTSIEKAAFRCCSSLNNISFEKNSSLKTIDDIAFLRCSSLKQIEIPYSVTSIGSSCFYECISLENVFLPPTVTEIGWSAFDGCKSLEKISIPESVGTIHVSTFLDCSSLKQVTVHSSEIYVASNAFKDCSSLEQIEFLSTIKYIGYDAFKGCSSLAQIVIHSDYKFENISDNPKIEIMKILNN